MTTTEEAMAGFFTLAKRAPFGIAPERGDKLRDGSSVRINGRS
jgi:hypothetical protein